MTDIPRFLLSLTLIPFAAIAIAHTRQEGASVTYLNSPTQSCKVVLENNQTWLAESTAKQWGWQFSGSQYSTTISINGLTASIDTKTFEGHKYFPIERSVRQLDAELVPINGNRLQFRIVTHIRVVRYEGGHLEISSSLPFSPTYQFSDPQTLEVDAKGATLSPDVILDLGPGITLAQPNHHKVRFLVQNISKFDLSKESTEPTAALDFNVQPAGIVTTPPPSDTTPFSPIQLFFNVNKEGGSALRFPFSHSISGYPKIRFIDPKTLQIRFNGIRLKSNSNLGGSQYFTGVDITPHSNYTIATVHLVQPTGFIALNVPGEFQLRFYPQSPDSQSPFATSSPKIITIDPGHGGKDDGAENDPIGVKEKNLTILIGYKLARDLSEQGAAVYMTRASDHFVPLSDRVAIATANHSQIFVSVHINSTNNTTTRGSIVFYHGSDQTSHNLAIDLEREVAQASSIPEIGAWSDTRIYGSGFYVLRNATMPAVLCELGFINNRQDLNQLINPAVQSKIALQLVKGIELYLNSKEGQ